MYNILITLNNIFSPLINFFTLPNSVALLYILNIIIVFTIIFLEYKKASASWAWILVLFSLPFLGFILYLLLGRPIYREKIFPYSKEERIDFQREILNRKSPYIESQNQTIEKHKNLIELNYQSNQSFLSTDNSVEILSTGTKKFNKLFEDIKNAKSYIYIQYYIIKKDSLGTELFKLLISKLNEGVEVYLLYDDIGSRTLNKYTLRKLIAAGAKTKSFFKSKFALVNLRMNYRNHRKLVIVDGEIAYTGGFNVGDEYIGLDKKMGAWRDTHLRLKGEVVSLLNFRFIDDWNSQVSRKNKAEYINLNTQPVKQLEKTNFIPMQIVTSGPDEAMDQIKYAYLHMINQAKKYIYIQTPYFIPDESVMDALKMAILSGIDVRIMIPDRPDHIFVRWANYSNVGKLIELGATIYEYHPGFLHAKTILIDDEVSSVGTANFDNRSFKLNFEINTFIYDIETTSNLRKIFLDDVTKSSVLTKEKYATRSNLIKIKEALAQLISPIL